MSLTSRSVHLPKIVAAASVALVAGVTFALAAAGCSSTTPATCDDASCLPGNKCLALNGEVKCRKLCSSNTDPSAGCPFNYTCTSTAGQNFCVQDNLKIAKKEAGQWGARCNPAGGVDKNPDCDVAQGFWCFGQDPTDGDAYCTQYFCNADHDCAAGYYCGTVNKAPNVTTAKRSLGADQTLTVCLRRTYCAPCTADFDCPPQNGIAQHCLGDANGNGFCAPECSSSKNCAFDAKCAGQECQGDACKFHACVPRAGVCVGDGSLCSPCRSDKDCPTGACVRGTEYSTERFCAIPATGGACAAGACPKLDKPTDPKVPVGCTSDGLGDVPKGYCVGLFNFEPDPNGGSKPAQMPGCWTPDRL